MKNIFRFLMAAAIMFGAVSCAKEDISTSLAGGEVEVTFTADLGQLGTRVYGDGKQADYYVYLGVYNEGGVLLENLTDRVNGKEITNHKATIRVVLLKDKHYKLVFWAQHKDQRCYSMDWTHRQLTVDYDNVPTFSQDDTRDAFFLVDDDFHAGHDETVFTLKRPFAQLRAAISKEDFDFVDDNNVTITHSEVVVEGIANVLDLSSSDAEVSGNKTVTFASAEIPNGDNEKITVNGTEFYQLSMNYLLVNEKTLVDVEYTFTDGQTDYVRPYYAVPVQRNYRTNILGQLISSPMDFTVIINPEFDGAHEVEDIAWDGKTISAPALVNNTYEISNAAEWAWLKTNKKSGNNIKLVSSIDFNGHEIKGIGFAGEFDGQGYTMSNMTILCGGSYYSNGLFQGDGSGVVTVKNVTLKDVVAECASEANGYVGAIFGDVQNNVTLENVHIDNADLQGVQSVGGLIGFVASGTTVNIKNCSVNNSYIHNYKVANESGFVAGFVGRVVGTLNLEGENAVNGVNIDGIYAARRGEKSIDAVAASNSDGSNINGINTVTVTNTKVTKFAVDGLKDISSQADLDAAIAAPNTGSNVVLTLNDGEFTLSGVQTGLDGATVTFNGNGMENTIVNGGQTSNNQQPGVYAHGKHLVFKDLTYVTPNNGYQGGFGHAASVTFINCKIIGQFYAHSNAPHNFIECTIDPLTGYLYTYGSDCVFEGCTFESSEGKALQVYEDAANGENTVSIKNCTFKAAKVANTWDGKPVTAIDINSNGALFNVAVENCTATGYGVGLNSGSDLWNIKNNAQCVNLTIDGELKSLAGYGIVNGYYSVGDTYTVLTGEGFKNVATNVLSDGSKNVTIELANDIDLAGIEWPAVKTAAAFVLDGKGYTIKNLTTSAVEDHGFYSTAMFTSTRKATTIKNLVVENATVTGKGGKNSHGAVLVACNYASLSIEGVTVKGSTVSNCDRSSALVTYLYFTTATVKDCVVEGCTVNSIGTAGAILGMNNSHNFEATGNTVKNTTISSSEGGNKAGILIGTWQQAGTLTQSGNVVENSKAINAGTETNNEIGRLA